MKTRASEVLKHPRRACGLLLAICVFIGLVGRLSAWAQKVSDQPVIRVWIYDYAHVGRTDLGEAERQAAGIFAGVGVYIAWTVVSQSPGTGKGKAENADADFFIRILPASMARRGNYTADTMGEAVTGASTGGTSSGRIANVFCDRVEHISLLWGLDLGQILGDAMAHELGHLLLGSQHSSQGIMKVPWTLQDLELAGRGNLPFLPAEITALQRAVRALPRNSSTVLTALH